MEGILSIDKPQGYTSFDVIARLRGILHTRRLGHSGTLDPMATGVLPVFVGKATRAVDLLPDQSKRYTAVMQLGITTDTQDITGEILQNSKADLPEERVREALLQFEGEGFQIPPMYSAVKVNGQRLYDLARQGIEVERKKRPVTFSSINLLAYDRAAGRAVIDVACSKGAYIRTLIDDVGCVLGTGAALAALRRTMACGFSLADCYTLEEIEKAAQEGKAGSLLHPVQEVFQGLEKIVLDAKRSWLYINGVKLTLRQLGREELVAYPGLIAVFGEDDVFLGIAESKQEREDWIVKSKVLFASRN